MLRVDDDGPGIPDGVLSDPSTSLAVMAEHLRGYSGSLAFSPAGRRRDQSVRSVAVGVVSVGNHGEEPACGSW